MTPTVGRIVHYAHVGFETGAQTLAAIVTRVHEDGRVNLTVFHNVFEEHVWAASYDETGAPGTWRWPSTAIA